MLALNEAHKTKIRQAWERGNPRILAEAARLIMFSKEFENELGLDHDDQVGDALYIGILAADAVLGGGKKNVEDFITSFEKEVLNGERVY
jgi:hypothetical protein